VISRADRQAVVGSSSWMRLTRIERTHHPRTPTFDLNLYAVELMPPTR
jgi:hypothetical protein